MPYDPSTDDLSHKIQILQAYRKPVFVLTKGNIYEDIWQDLKKQLKNLINNNFDMEVENFISHIEEAKPNYIEHVIMIQKSHEIKKKFKNQKFMNESTEYDEIIGSLKRFIIYLKNNIKPIESNVLEKNENFLQTVL